MGASSTRRTVLRSAGAVVVGSTMLAVLELADPLQIAPLAAVLAVVVGTAAGRLVGALGLPRAVGWLGAGVMLGASVGHAVARVWPAWPFHEGLLGPAELVVLQRPSDAAWLVVMLWIGRRLEPTRLAGLRRAVGGMVTGHVVVLLGAAALGGWMVLEGRLGAGVVEVQGGLADVVGVAVALLGTSSLLVAGVLQPVAAEGPVTRTILWLAVLGEVAALSLLVGWSAGMGAWTGLGILGPGAVERLVFTVGVGVLVGLILAAGARWSPTARGAWVVGVAVVSTVAIAPVGVSVPLVGLVAGLVLASVAPGAPSAALELGTSAGLVLLLVQAGALLPVRALVDTAPLALLLATVRALLLFGAAIAVARLVGAPGALVRYGWTGLWASSIPVFGLVAWRIQEPGAELGQVTAIVWGMAAVDGLAGALAVHLAVGLARETPVGRLLEVQERGVPRARWELPEALPEGPLRTQLEHLADDLALVVRELRHDMLAPVAERSQAFLEALRREVRRHHRKVVAIAAGPPEDAALALRLARTELAERWRSFLVDHGSRLGRRGWHPTELVETLDRLVGHLPASVAAPTLPSPQDGRQAVRAFTAWLVGVSPRAPLPFRNVAGHHLAERTPARLEAVASAVVNGELALAARARELFHRVLDAYDVVESAGAGPELLDRIAQDLADDFRVAREESQGAFDTAAERLDHLLAEAWGATGEDLRRMVTLELPAWSRAPGRAAAERELGLSRLGPGFQAAMQTAEVRFDALCLEVELEALEIEVRGALEEHGQQLARLVRGRGTTQLERVLEAVDETLDAVDAALEAEGNGDDLADALRDAASGMSRVATDAAETADELREQLGGERPFAPLLDALLKAGALLTERYEVPVDVPLVGAWQLPEATEVSEVPFREVVLAYIETAITRDLLALTQRYGVELGRAIGAIEELDRTVGFNVELAAAEVALAGDGPVGAESRRVARALALEGIARARQELTEAVHAAQPWYDEVERQVQAAVLGDLDDLRVRIADGRFAELVEEAPRTRGAREADAAARVGVVQRATRALRDGLGETGLARAREALGLPVPEGDAGLTPARFAPLVPAAALPLPYRRLFSEQALEAGELLGGRHTQADRVREAVEEREGAQLRSVAVVGPGGAGQAAVIRAALRALRVRGIRRHDLDRAPTPAEVDAWFDRQAHGVVHVVTGLSWLYTLRPGGFEPLRRFVDGVLGDGGRNAWILEADELVWVFASAAAPLARAFPTVVRIEPLEVDELREAMLARHAMSELDLRFTEAGAGRARARYERSWFRDFHAACGGVARDAMQLWLAAIVEVDPARRQVHMGPVPAGPDAAMRHVTDRSALALQVAARQGYLDEDTWSRVFQEPPLEARAQLAHLSHWGLLRADGDRFVLPAHLRRALAELARARGWT
ncbi:MAG: hypothetical protein H6732_12470 [Alphaproteobacteria bacterium]|nr:hypothetical protein [Alphaproteobacteria bacterium]